jgi:hypothetical protein
MNDKMNYIITNELPKFKERLTLHPRKGCSRGVYIKNIQQTDISIIIEFLKSANE